MDLKESFFLETEFLILGSLRQMHARGRVLYRLFNQRRHIVARKTANGGIAHPRITWGPRKK
jgi:hypothetical protein